MVNHMKKLALAFSIFALPAFAQQAPTVDEMTNQYLVETGQLRMELGKVRAERDALRKQVEDAKKAPTKEPEKK